MDAPKIMQFIIPSFSESMRKDHKILYKEKATEDPRRAIWSPVSFNYQNINVKSTGYQ
jgi:hypothetical protein